MNELTIEMLINNVNTAIETSSKYVGVTVLNGFNNQREVIINTTKNMVEGKLDYYKTSYNEDLTLKTQPKIRIVGFTFADSFAEIESDLI